MAVIRVSLVHQIDELAVAAREVDVEYVSSLEVIPDLTIGERSFGFELAAAIITGDVTELVASVLVADSPKSHTPISKLGSSLTVQTGPVAAQRFRPTPRPRADTPSVRFMTQASSFRDALVTASRTTPTAPTLVAYSGVLVLASGRRVSVIGSDGETTVGTHLDVQGATDGQALVLPRPPITYLATVPPDTTITVSALDGDDVTIDTGRGQPYRFRPLQAAFPLPPAPKTEPHPCDLSRLGRALAAVRAATPRDHPGIQLLSGANGLLLHATDSYRLARATLPEAGFGDFSGVLPLPVLEQIARHPISSVQADPRGRVLRVSGPGITIAARLLSTPFPAVDTVLDAVPTHQVALSSADFRQALARLDSVAGSSPLRCRLKGTCLELEASSAELGAGVEALELHAPAPCEFEFAMNFAYLRDAVSAHEGDEVTLAYQSADQAVFLVSAAPLATTTVVMPVRV